MLVEAFSTLEVKFVARVGVEVPHVAPAPSAALAESEGDYFLHQRHEERQSRQPLHRLWVQCRPHIFRKELQPFVGRHIGGCQCLVDGQRGEDVAQVAVVSIIAPLVFLIGQPFHPLQNILLHRRHQCVEAAAVAPCVDHLQGCVAFHRRYFLPTSIAEPVRAIQVASQWVIKRPSVVSMSSTCS